MWCKIDGAINHHPKLTAAGPIASWLYICGLAFATTYSTDGLIPEAEASHLTPLDDPAAAITRLVAAGLWHRCRGGYQIHDFLDYQQPAAKMKAGRERHRRNQAAYRTRQRDDVRDRSRDHNGDAAVISPKEEESDSDLIGSAPLPPTPPPPDPEARENTPRALRAIPKPHEVERAELEGHPLFGPLVDLFQRPPTRELDAWRDDITALEEMGARPEQVPIAAEAYAAIMGDDDGRPILLTRAALIRHWHRCIQAASYPPARITVDGRMPIHGELDDGKYTGGGKYARFFNRPYEDEPFDDVGEASP